MKNARQVKNLTSAVVPAQFSSTSPARKGAVVTMSSHEIAVLVEARHNDVIATIDRLFHKGLLRSSRKTRRESTGGRPVDVYDLIERDTHLVVAGYSDEHRARVIDRMTELEAALHMRQTEYLPGHHQLHAALSGKAPDPQHQRFLHMNANKLLNKVAGIQSGQRGQAEHGSLAVLTVAQMLAQHAAAGAPDHKAAYSAIKAALEPLQGLQLPAPVQRVQLGASPC